MHRKIEKERRTMRLVETAVACGLLLTGCAVFAGQDLGHPSPTGEVWEPTIGLGYHNYTSEWKPDDPEFSQGEIKRNFFWLQVGAPFHENWEAYVRIGAADLRAPGVFPFDPPKDFEGKYTVALTFGLKGLVYSTPSWGIGPFVQASFYPDHEITESGMIPENGGAGGDALVTIRYKDMYDASFGLGGQLNATSAIIYGGVFGYTSKVTGWGEVDLIDDPGKPERFKTDGKEKNTVGGFVGASVAIGLNTDLNLEGQYKSKASFTVSFTTRLGEFYD
jgi:hypothetical protein